MKTNKIHIGNCKEVLKTFQDDSIDMVVTSPPYYGLRNYCVDGQLGLEKTPEQYVKNLVGVFREIKRVIKPTATVWLNLGDSYYGGGWKGDTTSLKGSKQATNKGAVVSREGLSRDLPHPIIKTKDLVGIPWRVAFALQADGWYLRQDIIWFKTNSMPESVKDRCVKSHEYVFLLTKSPTYYFDYKAIQEIAAYDGRKDTKMKGSLKYKKAVVPNSTEHTMAARGHERWQTNNEGTRLRNKRSVWVVPNKASNEKHYASFPVKLIKPMILAGSKENDIVLDPFMGVGTTAIVAKRLNRKFIGIELNPQYAKRAIARAERAVHKPKLLNLK